VRVCVCACVYLCVLILRPSAELTHTSTCSLDCAFIMCVCAYVCVCVWCVVCVCQSLDEVSGPASFMYVTQPTCHDSSMCVV